eukprot:741295-Hanusia_phi.AAC.1
MFEIRRDLFQLRFRDLGVPLEVRDCTEMRPQRACGPPSHALALPAASNSRVFVLPRSSPGHVDGTQD